MQELVAYTIFGLATGAIYALAAAGLVVTYTTTGTFNLAHGATGMLAAFVYWQLRYDWGWPSPLALALVLLVFCPLLGAGIERFIMRGLEGTSDVIRLMVTGGLMVAMIGLANWIWPPSNRAAFRAFFEGSRVEILGVNVAWHDIITLACAVAVALTLRVFFFRTRTGVAMRAVVDDRTLTQLNGGRPDQLAMFAWAGSASLAGLAGILLASEQQLNVIPLTLLVVNAYAAAIVGRLRNLPVTFAAAMVLGLADAYVFGYVPLTTTVGGYNLSGLRLSLPTILLFVALLAMPQARLRGSRSARVRESTRVPSWSTSILGAALLVAGVAATAVLLTPANTLLLRNGLLFAIAALSLVPLTGYAGQLSLAPMTFAGIGAVAMAKLPGDGSLLTLLGAMAIAAAVGALVALPALRLQGIYLALATGAFAVFVSNVVFNQPKVFVNGNIRVPALKVPGLSLAGPTAHLVALGVAFAVLGLAVVAIRRSALGRRFVALKDSPIASATLGLDVRTTKLAAFSISAAIAACGGALAGRQVTPDEYTFISGMAVVLLAVAGGVGAVSGALAGGLALGANTILAVVVPAFRNAAALLPGLIGISLGRNPNGISGQVAEGYRPVGRSWAAVALSIAGAGALWLLAWQDAISGWSFSIALAVWVVAGVPLLGQVFTGGEGRPAPALGLAVAATVGAALVDWESLVATTGWRIVAGIATIALVTIAARAVLRAGTTAAPERVSPDLAGVDRPFAAAELDAAERALGVTV